MPRRSTSSPVFTLPGLALLISNNQQYEYSAIQRDQTRLSGKKLVAEAKQLRSEGAAGRKAIQKFEEALPLIRANGDRQQEAEVLVIEQPSSAV